MANNNGHISKPVNGSLSLGELAQLFGCTADLGTICSNTHGQINPWSKVKPVRSIKVGILSDNDRKAENYGFDLSLSSGTIAQSSAACLNAAKANHGSWAYLPPRGASRSPKEWFRLFDFDGYSHHALAPYSITYQQRTNVLGNKSIPVFEDVAAEIKFTDLSADSFEDLNPHTAYLYLLWRKRGFATNLIRSNDTLENIFQNQSSYTFSPIPMTTNGIYEFVVAAAEWDEDDEVPGDTWVYLPGTYGECIVDDSAYILQMFYDDDEELPAPVRVIEYPTDEVTIEQAFLFYNDIDPTIRSTDTTVTSLLSYMDNGVLEPLATRTQQVENLPYEDTSDSVRVTFNRIDISNVPSGGDIKENLYIQTYYSYKENGTGQFITRYFDYLADDTSSNVVAPVSLKSVTDLFTP